MISKATFCQPIPSLSSARKPQPINAIELVTNSTKAQPVIRRPRFSETIKAANVAAPAP